MKSTAGDRQGAKVPEGSADSRCLQANETFEEATGSLTDIIPGSEIITVETLIPLDFKPRRIKI